MIRLVFTENAYNQLANHLHGSSPLEEGAFCLVREGRGASSRRLLVDKVLLPQAGDWESQNEGLLRPSAQWVSFAVSQAINCDAGLLFIHSHPHPEHPCGFSGRDKSALLDLGRTLQPIIDGPFVAVVVHARAWAGAVVERDTLVDIDRIWAVGRTIRNLSLGEKTPTFELDIRQKDALGNIHDQLRTLDIAVIGCGGLGSPVAEQLTRAGARSLILNDKDTLDTPSNVRRVFGAMVADIKAVVPPPKVDVVGRHVEQLGFGTHVRRVHGDVRSERVFREILDADVAISATDTHGSRAVLNDLASSYLLPVIDVGTRVGTRAQNVLCSLIAEVRVLTPATPCLWCRKTISADTIRIENLPAEQCDRLRRDGYVIGDSEAPAPSVVALTVLGAGLATCALIGLFAEDADSAPSAYWIDGLLGDARETAPAIPVSDCRCRLRISRGDTAPPPFLS
ncbi:MAG: ThiF family adenylyltransferase [Terriglobales bacterium]